MANTGIHWHIKCTTHQQTVCVQTAITFSGLHLEMTVYTYVVTVMKGQP